MKVGQATLGSGFVALVLIACGGAIAPGPDEREEPVQPAVPFFLVDAGTPRDSGVRDSGVRADAQVACSGFEDFTTASGKRCDQRFLPKVSSTCSPLGTYQVQEEECVCGPGPRRAKLTQIEVTNGRPGELAIRFVEGGFTIGCSLTSTCECNFANEDWFRFSPRGFEAVLTSRAYGVAVLAATKR